ncbi:hypothetical protein [Amycolatopsis sp. cmx-4-83]|uniref:hypothetical protein n=1 Tax=Amycolatopsis sp. cmx-4-83 TaxID=2790940 RepID=UPI00397A6BA6
MSGQLYNRTVEPKILRQLLIRPEDGDPRYAPAVLFEGDARTGKTQLLRTFARGWAGKIPYSFLDVAAVEDRLGEDALPELLAAIAAQLSRRCALYGSLRFDRLVIGLKAAQLDLDDDPAGARRQVETMLTERLGLSTLKKVLTGVAQQALKQVPSPVEAPGGLVQVAVDAVVDGAAGRLLTRNALGRARSWYAHRDRHEVGDAVGQLIDLNTALRTPELADAASQAGELLCDALLADLRDNFRTARHADEWAAGCLVLLDNVDCALGTRFLGTVAELRTLDAAAGVSLPAPWVLAGTSRGALLGALPPAQRAAVLDLGALTDLNTPEGTDPPWARRRLPFLTADDVRKLVSTVPEARRHPNLGSCVHLVTGGHPGAAVFLLDAVAATAPGDPEHLLDAAHGASTVRDALTHHLTAGLDETVVEALITCSAARDRHDGQRLATRLPATAGADLPLAMWDDTGTHPTTVVRALLLRNLADRTEDHLWSWRRTHEFLGGAGPADSAAPARLLHHTLALGETTVVLDELARRLGTMPLPEWLTLLLTVTSAPARGARTVATGPWPGFLPSLVNRLWTAADPLSCANRRTLHTRIAGGLAELANHLDDTCDELTDLIADHQAQARRWRPALTRSAAAPGNRFEGVS